MKKLHIVFWTVVLCQALIELSLFCITPKIRIHIHSGGIYSTDGYYDIIKKYERAADSCSVCDWHEFQTVMFPAKYCTVNFGYMRNAEGERTISGTTGKQVISTWAEPLGETTPSKMGAHVFKKEIYGYFKPDGTFIMVYD